MGRVRARTRGGVCLCESVQGKLRCCASCWRLPRLASHRPKCRHRFSTLRPERNVPSAGRATADPELERGQTCHPRGWPAGRGMSPWSSPASFHLLRSPVTAWRLRKRAGQKQGSRCPVCTVEEGRGGAPHLDGHQGAR